MLIEFEKLPESVVPHFYGGEKEMRARMFSDSLCRIGVGTLLPGASIGEHRHGESAEIVYVLRGRGRAWCDGAEEGLAPGLCHYCPKGSSHSMVNDGEEDLVVLTVVPRQP